jgi:threonine dehydratase
MTEAADFQAVADAAQQIRGAAVETPLLRSDTLDELVGARVWIKAECLQRTGSFKFRGAYNKISRLADDQRGAGVVAYSSGNHAPGGGLRRQADGRAGADRHAGRRAAGEGGADPGLWRGGGLLRPGEGVA